MRCPDCGINHKKAEGMRCRCGYIFALVPNPSTGNVTDGKFLAILRRAGNNDTFYFTENGLFRAYRARLSKDATWLGCLAISLLLLFIGSLLFFASEELPGAIALSVMGVLGCLASLLVRLQPPPRRQEFQRALDQWITVKGVPEKLLREPAMHQPPEAAGEPDLYDYGVERIIVVERDVQVDLLVKNGLPQELRALIIGALGYPNYLVPVAERFLSEKPDLPVLLLHDAAPKGHLMALPGLPFIKPGQMRDLGLFLQDLPRIGALKPLRPAATGEAIPLDALPYPTILSLVGLSATHQSSIDHILDRCLEGDFGDLDFG